MLTSRAAKRSIRQRLDAGRSPLSAERPSLTTTRRDYR